jgi:hypothetical protein
MHEFIEPTPHLDVIAAVSGEEVIAEIDVRNNAKVRIGDQYTVTWPDGAMTVMRITGFRSAEDYSNTIARRIDAMRKQVVGPPQSLSAREAYQIKLAVLRIEGELLPNGDRLLGAIRAPDVMQPLTPISDDATERFATDPDGNIILGFLRSGSRVLPRVARIRHNYAGDRMVVFGMPGKGKTQLVRSLLSQAMSDGFEDSNTEEENNNG